MTKYCLLITAFWSAIPALALADTKKAKPQEGEQIIESVICSRKQDERKIESQTKGTGCILHYRKFSETKEVAHAVRGVEVCLETQKKMQATLEHAGFKCE